MTAATIGGPVLRFVELADTTEPRTAAYDSIGIWHDPGNGQFAKPGWSTAKGLALGLLDGIENMAREHVRHNPQGDYLTARDTHLRGIGVPQGSNVRVKYLNDEFGIVDVTRDGERRPHLVPWERFSDDIPDEFATHNPTPEFTGQMNRPNEEKVGLVNRLSMNGGKGYVEVVGNELNRYGVPVGSVLEATLRDDGSVSVTAPNGARFLVPPRLLEPSLPPGPDDPTPTVPDPPKVPAPTTSGIDVSKIAVPRDSDTQRQIDRWRNGQSYGDDLTTEEDDAERRMAREYHDLLNPKKIGSTAEGAQRRQRRLRELEQEHQQFVKDVKTRQRAGDGAVDPTPVEDPVPSWQKVEPLDRAPEPGESFTGDDVMSLPDGTEVHGSIIPDHAPLRFVKREDGLHRYRLDNTEDPTGAAPIPRMEYKIPVSEPEPNLPDEAQNPPNDAPDVPNAPVDESVTAPIDVPEPAPSNRATSIADAAEQHGIPPEAVAAALDDLPALRAELRDQARALQFQAASQLDRADAMRLARPPAKTPKRQLNGSVVWSRGAAGEWDWFDQLAKPEQERLRQYWMVGTDASFGDRTSFSPDQLQSRIADTGVGSDVSDVDSAMKWWLHQTRVIDGLRSVAAGRTPARNGLGADDLGIQLEDGVNPSDFLGRERFDAAGAVAAARLATEDRFSQEEIDQASQYLANAYTAPEGERPWDLGYVRWVAEVDDYLDAADAYEQDGKELPADIADRIDQLLPLGSDPNQSLEEAYAEIAEMAKAAGETVNPDVPGAPDAPAADAPSADTATAPEQSATHAVAALFDRIHEKPTLEDKTEAEALADHIFAHDLGGGFSTKVTATNPNRSGGLDEMSLTVRGDIVAPDGRHVRSWEATITPENVNADTPLADQDPDIGVSFSRIDQGRGTIIDAALNSALSDAIRTAADDNGFSTSIEAPTAVAQAGEPVDLASLNPGDTFAASDIPGRWLMGSDGKVYGLNEDGTVTSGVLRDDVAAALSDREFTTAEPFEPAFPDAPELGTAFDGSNASMYASAVASGQVTLDELRDTLGMTDDQLRSVGRSGGGGGHEDVNNGSYGFAPLPEQMFHVTTAADSVLANGLKTASERQSGGTLGLGGSSDEISLASDVAHAEAIRDGILEAVDVAQGNITYDDMVRRAIDGDRGSQPFGDKFVAQMKYSLGLPDEWQPGDPIPETNGRDPLDLWKQFSLMRMNADGPRDPLIMTSADNLRRINPDQVQIMSVAPANDRAMGIPLNLGGTADDGEWRVPTGRALKVNGIADTPDPADPGMFDATGYTVDTPDATPDTPAPESLTAANEFQRPTKRLTPAAVGQMVANGEPLWHRSEVADDAQAMALLRTQAVLKMNDPADVTEETPGPVGTAVWREKRGYKLSPEDQEMLGVARREPDAVGKLFAKFRRQYEGKAKDSKVSAEVELPPEVRDDAHAAWKETVTHPALVAAFDKLGIEPPAMMLSRYRNPWDNDRDANGTYTAGSDTVWMNSTDFWGGISAGLSDEEARSYPISITDREPARIGMATTSAGDRRAVMIHETGHYAHDHLAVPGSGFTGTPLADEWKRLWEDYHGAYQAALDAATGETGGIAKLHKRQLSFYSHENFQEGFAETFGLVARGADPSGLDPSGRALFDWMSKNVFGLAPDESYADLEIGQTYTVKGVKIQRTADGYIDLATGDPVTADGKPL